MALRGRGQIDAVMVTGAPGVDIHALVEGIKGEPVPERSDDGSVDTYGWTIDNRYYVAPLDIHCTDRFLSDDDERELWGRVDALVVAFNAHEEATFEHVQLWHKWIGERREPAVLICAVMRQPNAPFDTTATLQWCVEAGFEMVEVIVGRHGRAGQVGLLGRSLEGSAAPVRHEIQANGEEAEVEEGRGRRGDAEEDMEDGIQRMVAALHANMWRGMERKGGASAGARAAAIVAAVAPEKDSDSDGDSDSDSEREESTIAYAAMADDSGDEHDGNATSDASSHGDEHDGPSAVASAHAASHSEPEPARPSLTGEPQQPGGAFFAAEQIRVLESLFGEDPAATEEQSMDTFERAFSTMALLKQRADELAPEERRKMAESVALSFYRAMGGGDEDDEDDLDLAEMGLDEDDEHADSLLSADQ